MKNEKEAALQNTSLFTLPQENLENVCEYLKIAELSSFSRSCSFFHNSLQEYTTRHPEVIKYNLQKLNCYKRIFNGQNEPIYGIGKWRDILITSSRGAVKTWNIDTGEPLWTYSDNLQLCEELWIIDGKAICSGRKQSGKDRFSYDENIILIIDFETKNTSIIRHEELVPELTTVVGNQIITKFRNGYINCWDLSGLLLKNYQSATGICLSGGSQLLATKHYIADIHNEQITIVNRQSNELVTLTANESVYSAIIADDLLICGLAVSNPSNPDIIIIDMKQAKITDSYKTEGLLHLSRPIYGCIENSGVILSVAAKSNMLFMSHESGKVVAVDLKKRTHELLETFSYFSPYLLYLQDKYLFIQVGQINNGQPRLSIWDIDEMKKIKSIEISDLHKVKWHKGELLVSAECSLIKYDFKVVHQGEILAKCSPNTLERRIDGMKF